MSMLASEMGEVVLQCDHTQTLLDSLEHDLVVLHEIVSRENASLIMEKSSLLAELWTLLGGNRRHLADLDKRVQMLKEIGDYRTDAKAHVDKSLVAVQQLGDDMEELRVRVAAPAIIEDRIPIEVQLRSIQSGLERMRSTRRQIQDAASARRRGVGMLDG